MTSFRGLIRRYRITVVRTSYFLKRLLRILRFYLKRVRVSQGFSSPPVPALHIETTNVCNSKCVFCANPIMKRRKEALSMDAFKKVVDEFVSMGGTKIDFSVTIGDPLLDKDLLQRARYVKQFPQFRSNGFVTTLQWLHLHNIDEFFNAGFTWVSISLTLSGREKYRDFFGVDQYDHMLKNLVFLLNENVRRNNPLAINISIKPTDEPIESVLDHPDYQMIRTIYGPKLDKNLYNNSFFVDDWLGAVKLPKYLKKRPLYPRRHRPCQLLYRSFIVYSNGNVGACSCRDFEATGELILGNIQRDSLTEMWNGERLSKIRTDWIKENKIPNICKTCRFYVY